MCHDALEGLRRPAGLYVRGDTLYGIEEVGEALWGFGWVFQGRFRRRDPGRDRRRCFIRKGEVKWDMIIANI